MGFSMSSSPSCTSVFSVTAAMDENYYNNPHLWASCSCSRVPFFAFPPPLHPGARTTSGSHRGARGGAANPEYRGERQADETCSSLSALVEIFNFFRVYLHVRQRSGFEYTEGFHPPVSCVTEGFVVSFKVRVVQHSLIQHSFAGAGLSRECSEEFP